MRKNWGDATIFKGSTLTFGGLAYHGDGPYNQRFATPDTHRDDDTAPIRVDQDRESDYQAFFFENIFRLGKFHIVPSFRLDHERVEVDENVSPFAGGPGQRPLATPSADHWVPLWGVGLGNDFGNRNETYFSASSGWRPTRWFDISSPFQNIAPGHPSDPFYSLDFELGVHGTPWRGFWYDVGGFWMLFDNRTETRQSARLSSSSQTPPAAPAIAGSKANYHMISLPPSSTRLFHHQCPLMRRMSSTKIQSRCRA